MYSPSSSSSAAILSRSRANENDSSVMVVTKCLPTRRPMSPAAAQRLLCALRGRHDRYQVLLRGGQQLRLLAPPLLGQYPVAAHDEALAAKVG